MKKYTDFAPLSLIARVGFVRACIQLLIPYTVLNILQSLHGQD